MQIPNEYKDDFERYCIGGEGSIPPEDSDEWDRISDAFMAYRAASLAFQPGFNVRGTQSGRFSAKEPNIPAIPTGDFQFDMVEKQMKLWHRVLVGILFIVWIVTSVLAGISLW